MWKPEVYIPVNNNLINHTDWAGWLTPHSLTSIVPHKCGFVWSRTLFKPLNCHTQIWDDSYMVCFGNSDVTQCNCAKGVEGLSFWVLCSLCCCTFPKSHHHTIPHFMSNHKSGQLGFLFYSIVICRSVFMWSADSTQALCSCCMSAVTVCVKSVPEGRFSVSHHLFLPVTCCFLRVCVCVCVC